MSQSELMVVLDEKGIMKVMKIHLKVHPLINITIPEAQLLMY